MSQETIPIKRAFPIIVTTWIISLLTTLIVVSATVGNIRIGDRPVTTAKIADGAVTANKLASGAIPFAVAYSNTETWTTSQVYIDMPDMAVSITLNRTSHLVIMFSAVASNFEAGERIIVRALVGDTIAQPGDIFLTPIVSESTEFGVIDHDIGTVASAHNFYLLVLPGTYTVKIQWRVTYVGLQLGTGTESIGYVWDRTLTVIALPA
jgi:hypothetical protein